MWTALSAAGPWAAFLAVVGMIAWAYYQGKVISPREYKRTLADHERALEVERRIAGFHEKRAEVEQARADRATDSLLSLVSQLPEAMRYVPPPGPS